MYAVEPFDLHTTSEVLRDVGVSARQLYYWVTIGLIEPEVEGYGSGHHHGWSYRNLVELRIVRMLAANGVRPSSLVPILHMLARAFPSGRQELDSVLRPLVLVLAPEAALVALEDFPDVVRRSTSAAVVALPLAQVTDEAYMRLRSAETAPAARELILQLAS